MVGTPQAERSTPQNKLEQSGENRAQLLALEKEGQYLFHGSLTELAALEPRQAEKRNELTGAMEPDGAPAVFATPYADLAIFRALVNSIDVDGDSTSGFGVDGDQLTFSATQNLLDQAQRKVGRVYVLDKNKFGEMEGMQARSDTAVVPVQFIEVTAADLPPGIKVLEKEEEGEAHLWVQPQPPWEDFAADNIDADSKRKPATPDQIKEMDARMRDLGEAFAGSTLNWHLDGALNISLMNRAYIGYHKDVDISVEKTELAQVEAQLYDHGYGLFLSRTNQETGERTLRRVGFKVFEDSEEEHMLIAAIDERGKLRDDNALNFVDVHVVARDEQGRALSRVGVALPEAWTKPHPIEFQGQQINLSHPAKVLYYKLHQARNYDATDIDRLVETGKLTVEDVDEVADVFEKEFVNTVKRGRKVFEPISQKINLKMTAEEIAQLFLDQEELSRGGSEIRPAFVKIGGEILASGDSSIENILSIAIKVFGVEEKNNNKRTEILKIRKAVEAQSALAQVRERVLKKK